MTKEETVLAGALSATDLYDTWLVSADVMAREILAAMPNYTIVRQAATGQDVAGSRYICPEHPELGALPDRDWTRHENDGKHPVEMRVRSKHGFQKEWGWAQHIRVPFAAPTTREGFANLLRSAVGR